jgi:hypothetical protein
MLSLIVLLRHWPSLRLVGLTRDSIGRKHLELTHHFQSFLNVQSQGLEAWMNVNLAFLGNLIFSNDIKVGEGLMKKRGHITCLLKDLGVRIVIDKLQ